MNNKITETGFVRKKSDNSVHQIANVVDENYVRLKYHPSPTKISTLVRALQHEYENYMHTQSPKQ